ncbi:MAG: 3-methyl-2-oxobutanoate hydroxymethyltransferase, partial [Phenylobacterium sp.]
MSARASAAESRISVRDIRHRKGGAPLVCLTAYSAPMAKLLDPHCDILLVGDSVGMVLHGLPSTVGVTLDMMIMHGQAVMRGSRRAMVISEANPSATPSTTRAKTPASTAPRIS